MGRTYTLVNQKGGVGKTTTVINLGAYLAYFGQRVLLVDLDPQANATACLGVDKESVRGGTYESLIDNSPAASHILHNPRLKISLLPASPAMAGAEVELVGELAPFGMEVHADPGNVVFGGVGLADLLAQADLHLEQFTRLHLVRR